MYKYISIYAQVGECTSEAPCEDDGQRCGSSLLKNEPVLLCFFLTMCVLYIPVSLIDYRCD
jgi:hypothetical protein